MTHPVVPCQNTLSTNPINILYQYILSTTVYQHTNQTLSTHLSSPLNTNNRHEIGVHRHCGGRRLVLCGGEDGQRDAVPQ